MLALFHMPSWPLCVFFGEMFIKLFEQLVCIASLTRFQITQEFGGAHSRCVCEGVFR